MNFPVYLHIGSLRLHPHWAFETLAYAVAFRGYLWMRRKREDVIDPADRWWVIAAAMMGAAVGSKVLYECGKSLSRRELIELRAGRSKPHRKTRDFLVSI